MCSRPRRTPRISPARDSTSRCFLTACRETGDALLRRTMDSGPCVVSRTSSRRRVASPTAANTGAASRTCRAAPLRLDLAFVVLRLLGPALGVHPEGLCAAAGRELVEARLHHAQLRSSDHGLETELDKRGGLLRVGLLRIDRVGMPAQGEERLGLHLLHQGAELQ